MQQSLNYRHDKYNAHVEEEQLIPFYDLTASLKVKITLRREITKGRGEGRGRE